MPTGQPPSSDMPQMEPMNMPAMHTAFFWGHRAQVLFHNWPGADRSSAGMYVLCLLIVAALASLVEALSAASHGLSRRSRRGDSNVLVELILAAGVHATKMGLSYMAMLAVMSFNAGVFLAVVAGHAAGFMLVRSRVFGCNTRADVPTINGNLATSAEPKP
ncbi:hypothetical protein PR202_gb26386 [Eleusine coracana subsp. coracana]|uniref:Copper transport protein n=1 Tax=Eleusine coracana subsp. coracana TaxID=191504 RepID=A0AAV5FRQ8_ELECO|nr:hypothetical protein PR202_gb26386 [Eleusine coracana subsp. coracana]